MQVAKFELLIILLNLSHNTIDSVRNDLVLTVNEQNEATALGDVTLPVSKSTTSFQRLEDLEKAIYLLAEDFEKFKRHSSCFRTVANRLKHKLHNHIHRQIKHADRAETTFAHSHVHRSPGVPMGPESRPSSRLSRRALRDDDPAPGHGLDGVPGLDGAPGLDGVPGLDGRNGKDGKDGRDGRDGKDGQAGERGPPGVPGPPGEQGKRGKQGPPGKVGAAGPAGVCAYRAKFDCGLLATNGSGQVAGSALLMAPTMIGGSAGDVSTHNGDQSGEERQVTVSEGDNIQLSCEAFALPKPQYVWQRSDRKTAIILDSESDFHVSSYPGSQLPLVNVDRSQAGSYECIASNGVPPSASKRVTLNVNYAPTIHIYPGPSVYRVQFGSSIQLECIVEANPSSFTYWTFGSALLMSVPITQSQQQAVNGVGGSGGDLLVEQQPEKASSQLDKKYIITESAGELTTGASFNIMTLNITNLQRTDLGLYKCISKNLIGQSEGYIWLESSLDDSAAVASSSPEDRNYRELILEQSWQQQQPLDRTSGWPSRLLERKGNYSTFGSVRRRSFRKPTSASGLSSLIKRPQVAIPGGQPDHTGDVDDDKLLVSPDLQLNRDSSPLSTISPNSGSSIDGNSGSSSNESVGRLSTKSETTTVATSTLIEETDTGRQQSDDLTDETELCRSEKLTNKQLAQSGNFQSASRPSFMLLDQVGKPVYLGSVVALNWWSVDITYLAQTHSSSTNELTPPASNQVSSFYATSMNAPDKLFKYSSLADLLKDSVSANKSQAQQTGATSRSVYKLKHNMFGDSRLIVGGRFLYVSLLSSIGDDELLHRSSSSLESAQLVLVDLDNDDYQYLKLDSSSLSDSLAKQPLDLGDDYKLSRVEIASDENGVWLIIPTIEQKLSKGHLFASQPHRATQSTLLSSSPRKIVERRLHALKLRLPSQSRRENGDSNTITNISIGSNNRSVEIEYHVSMKLDWRMIGQMFIIDGVLYGIKDRHLYSSKLQFAYDLYKCKLLSTEYLTEPHRTFTNHFGNTQMIKYNPNEPKRLYTIDSGNLLWCPVKLIKTKPDDIWH